jgi:hypothetical protein
MNAEEEEDLRDQYYDHIVRRRNIPRRMNWRHRANALSQLEVALAANIQSTANDYIALIVILLLFIRQMTTMINFTRRATLGGLESPIMRRLLQAVTYYSCLLTFCFYELDVLVQNDVALLNIHEDQVIPLLNSPPRNWLIDDLSEEDAYAWTRFCKHQLRLLMVHLRIPDSVVVGPRQRYRFSGEKLLIVCLTRIVTGDPWTRLIPSHFGGDARRWSAAFHWFINHLLINFYHKISGRSIEGWIGQVEDFKKAILDRLAQPAHPIELDYDCEDIQIMWEDATGFVTSFPNSYQAYY